MAVKKSGVYDAILKQVNAEMYSAYLYLQLSADASAMKWNGAAAWLRAHAGEEMTHASKFYDYLIRKGIDVKFDAIEKPATTAKDLHEIFKAVYGHEIKVTAMINKIMETAIAEKDYAAAAELQWFVTEQVEEEETARDIVDMLEKAGKSPEALIFIDHHLGCKKE
ncbi:ferritin [Methanorbis rubei]|uniref:Bacterial non-heme ferritin n=1 Tax=Methanorbis rubei TaxID=3028300 RepID=A0AAE4SBG8_9EURY|nr:Bacterial non-heme ferritin [Methanocorpusculaceae archaeon Cs1]